MKKITKIQRLTLQFSSSLFIYWSFIGLILFFGKYVNFVVLVYALLKGGYINSVKTKIFFMIQVYYLY